MATWEREIRDLMYDFCIGHKADTIIREVKASAKGNEPAEVLYDRVWSKFHTLLFT